MKLVVDGKPTDITVTDWRSRRENASPEQQDRMDRWVVEGTLTDDSGKPLDPTTAKRVVARLLGTYDHLPSPGAFRHRESGARRWLIPGLWPWGTVPMLGGNPKAGKTTLAADLTASLGVHGRRFLDFFEPADLAMDERHPRLYVRFIRTEGPLIDLEDLLVAAGVESAPDWLTIDHLDDFGGPGSFDLTEPENYEQWANYLTECEACDGTDDWSPSVLIVDGVTAILAVNGKGPEAYGLWFAQFRQLMKETDIPNALVVAHNTLAGGHLMGGVEAQAGADGLWNYWSSDPDNPHGPRWFSVLPREIGASIAKTRVRQVDGRLRLDGVAAPASAEVPERSRQRPQEADEVLAVAHRTAAYVKEHLGAGGQELTDHVESSSKGQNLAGRSRAVELGLIREERCGSECSLCEKPHYRRRHYYWLKDPG